MTNVLSRTERVQQRQRRGFRIAIAGALIGCAIAFPVLAIAKRAVHLPDHLNHWAWVILGPPAFYGYLLAMMGITARMDLKKARQLDEADSHKAGRDKGLFHDKSLDDLA